MSFRIIDHYPDINDEDIPRNIHIKVEFNKGVIPGSVKYNTVSVHDANTYSTLPGDLGVEYNASGEANKIVFQPSVNMTSGGKYRVYVFGEDNSVLSKDNEQLPETYVWSFTAGSGLYEGEMPTGIPSGTLSGVVSGVATTIATGLAFSVSSTDPQSQEPNLTTSLSGVYVTFSHNIASTLTELSGLVSVTETSVLY